MAPELLRHLRQVDEERKRRPSPSIVASSSSSRLRVTTALDVFSLGCVLYFFLTRGSHPFGSAVASRNTFIQKGEYNLSGLNKKNRMMQDLIKEMIHKSPEKRPPLQKILNGPIFNAAPLASDKELTKDR